MPRYEASIQNLLRAVNSPVGIAPGLGAVRKNRKS
jgi:hypothetical protein